MTVTEPGYVYIYVSNENGDPVEVFFDDFSVHLTGTDIVQKDDYYRFGGSFNAYTDLSTPQQDYLYNGVRLNKTTQLYETAFRTYDPYLGRFNHIDPLTAMVPGLSPYHFGFNNPVRYSDPMGLMGNTYASNNSQNPFDLMPKFTRTSPGSGNHWSDQYRDPYHNWMLMDTDGFRDFYGLDNGFGGTNLERAMELTGSFTRKGSSQGGSFFYGVNGMGDGNGNIIPGTEVYILYQHLTNSRPSGGSNRYDWSYTGNLLGVGGITYAGLENAVANKFWWMDAKGNYNSTTILEKGANGKFVRGGQGYRNGYNNALNAASKFKVAGNIVGGLSLSVTYLQFDQGQISGLEASVDAVFGFVGFLGPIGAGVSATYFIGKFGYEYFSGNTVFDKPR